MAMSKASMREWPPQPNPKAAEQLYLDAKRQADRARKAA